MDEPLGMDDLTVIGFVPSEGRSVAAARSALEAAATDVGAVSLRRWEGGDEASYAVFRGLDAIAGFGSIPEVEIVGQADLVVEPSGPLPESIDWDLGLSGSSRMPLALCGMCGGFPPSGHKPGCILAGGI